MSTLKSKRLSRVLLAFLIVLGAAGGFLYYAVYGANDFAEEKKIFVVSKGDRWEEIVDSLSSKGVIRSRNLFELVVGLYRKGTTAVVGKYEFRNGISNAAIYHSLIFGRNVVPVSVTLMEGRRKEYYARTFYKALRIDSTKFLALVNNEAFARSLGIAAPNLEGYLSPNTYSFRWQADEEEIVRRLVLHTDQLFTSSMRERAKELKLSIHQVLTLASIIEGEAFLDEERATISGVYHNRLRRGMRLEADPTIQFLLPDGPRRILFRDLEIQSPYNTYRNYGLPPGPINNPRAASIVAALYPEQHNFFFFVANGKGGHWFSRDYAGHMNNVRRFKRERLGQIRNSEVG